MITSKIPSTILPLVTAGTICIIMLAGRGIASAGPIVYFYQGNPLETSGVYQCPPVCAISGSFTVASELEANRSLGSPLTPLSYNFSNGLNTFTPANSTVLGGGFFVSTDADSVISEWSIQFINIPTPFPPGAPPPTYLETWHTPSGFTSVIFPGQAPVYTADWTFVYGCTPDGSFCSPIGRGFAPNNQGTWTSMDLGVPPISPVPEPGTLVLIGSGLVIALRDARRRRRG